MRKLLITALAVFCIMALSPLAQAFTPLTVTNMIGDNDGYGYGAGAVADGADLPFTNDPAPGAGWLFDNRTSDELAATDGSQATDVEDNFDVTFFHTFDVSQFSALTEAWFTIDISGLQQAIFGGYSHLYLDGVEVTDFLTVDQGAWGSDVLVYSVDLASLADGTLNVFFDNWTNDHIGIDFTMLKVSGVTEAIPEPTTMILFGLGMAGLGIRRKFRK